MNQWTEEDEREARAFAKGFVALMLYARTQKILMGFIGPAVSVVNMKPGTSPPPDQGEQTGTYSNKREIQA